MNPYLALQFSGPVVQAVADGILQSHEAILPLLEYWRDLSISTAHDTDDTLNFVGELVGFPRPLASEDFFSGNVFHFGSAATWETVDDAIGLGTVSDLTIGGVLTSAFPGTTSVLPADWYRELLPLVALVKYYGLTIETLDKLAQWAYSTYTIVFRSPNPNEAAIASWALNDSDPLTMGMTFKAAAAQRLWAMNDSDPSSLTMEFQTTAIPNWVMNDIWPLSVCIGFSAAPTTVWQLLDSWPIMLGMPFSFVGGYDIDIEFPVNPGFQKLWVLERIFEKFETSTVIRALVP